MENRRFSADALDHLALHAQSTDALETLVPYLDALEPALYALAAVHAAPMGAPPRVIAEWAISLMAETRRAYLAHEAGEQARAEEGA